MPDLDGELAELRDDLHGVVRQPEVGVVVERSRQARVRRRTQFAAAGAVLVVAAAIPLLRTTLAPVGGDPGTSPAVTTTTSTTPYNPGDGYHYDVDFADAKHGFAIRSKCAGYPGRTCTGELLVSEDGGKRWQPRAIPVELTPNTAPPRVFVFDARRVALARYTTDGTVGGGYYTADAGLTWTPVAPAGSDTSAAIPDGGLLDVACTGVAPECRPVLITLAPDTGRMLPLAAKLPLTKPIPTSTVRLAGGWWVTGTDPATGRAALAVTRDGRTWSVRPLPDVPDGTVYAMMAAHGTTLYAVAGSEAQSAPPRLLAVFRSVDGGSTWERTFLGSKGQSPYDLIGYPVATADGRLIIPGGVAWASRDGGRTFDVVPSDEVTGIIRPTRGGYLASPSFGMTNVYKLSTDGVKWTEITVH